MSQEVFEYHERTKHDFGRYAAGPGRLDWANQPDPYRRFEGSPVLRLPIPEPSSVDATPPYDDLFLPDSTVASTSAPPPALSLSLVSSLLYYSMSLSAWKQAGASKWSLRVNPSSGNLHPTEAYVVSFDKGILPPGVYHYAPALHALEQRADFPPALLQRLHDPPPLLLGLSSVFWREAWKYGERAFRYCNHDVGHAIAALSVSAHMHRRCARVLPDPSDSDVAAVLGLDRKSDFPHTGEDEHPDALLVLDHVGGAGGGGPLQGRENEPQHQGRVFDAEAVAALCRDVRQGAVWTGTANRLSNLRMPWDAIDAVALATTKPRTSYGPRQVLDSDARDVVEALPRHVPTRDADDAIPSGKLVRQRRSVCEMDATTSISLDAFLTMLARAMPVAGQVPWDAQTWPTTISCLALFVHRVDGLEPGLYMLVRDPAKLPELQARMHPPNIRFAWQPVPNTPAVPLYLLAKGFFISLAHQLSCEQRIASDGAFAVAMLADFAGPIAREGAYVYRRMFWEAGMIGQVLYLEAEASGVRGTGIGCYFDNPAHKVFSIADLSYQDLYHFTVGGPLEDKRLRTLDAYQDVRE